MLFWEHLLQFLLILTNYELHACFLIKTICPSQIVATYRGLTVAIDERPRETDSETELNNETTTSLACGKERGLKRARLKNAFDSREKQRRVFKTKTFFCYS